MSENYVKREEYNESLNRIHARVDDIAKETTQIGVYAKVMKESTDKMFDCMYGKNGATNGFVALMSKVNNQLTIHWAILLAMIVGIIGIIVKFYVK